MSRLAPRVLLTFALAGCAGAPASEEPTPAPAIEEPASGARGAATGSTTGTTTHGGTPPTPAALPAEIRARVHLPGPDVDDNHLFVRVSLGDPPWTISGCVTGAHGACEETQRIEVDEGGRAELVHLLAEVRAIPRCEPDGIFPGDRAYRLELTGFPGLYEGKLPGDVARIEARNEGPCRADARLAWWIAQRFQAR